ncbi:protein translocase subunit SecD [Stackebrandtia sp.]|uniref:protein translocase subunit SecD n=1 Tax=Stackebrandtia sp. TaxID=2023065 RepID=UPI002D76D76D|nr:protein translocase subunit SecD [Stackebrandtia sp.]
MSLIVVLGLVWLSAVASAGFTKFPTPKLGLDLQGGVTMTLKASLPNGDAPDPDRMEQARQIIENRVNGTGVAEPEVFIDNGRNIVVNVAGKDTKPDQLRQVGAPAQLRFREVLQGPQEDYTEQNPKDFQNSGKNSDDKSDSKSSDSKIGSSDSPSDSGSGSSSSSKPSSDSSSSADKNNGEDPAKENASIKKQRAAVYKKINEMGKKQDPKQKQKLVDIAKSFASQAASMAQQGQPITKDQIKQSGLMKTLKPFGKLKPDEVAVLPPSMQLYTPTIGCGQLNGRTPGAVAEVNEQVVACNRPSDAEISQAKKAKKPVPYVKYLLAKARVVGEDVSSAGVQSDPQQAGKFAVGLDFKSKSTKKWQSLANDTVGKKVAIVLDNEVISAPVTEQGAGSGGQVQISGDFSSDDANLLAEQLKYGSLPASFTVETIDEVSATLGLSQMKAGMLAGGIGVALVILYCLVYYRVMGLVVIASLGASGAILYPAIAMLGAQIGFTLTLAGIAGFIVAIGITADSFVVFFERLKDEMKEGRSTRSAVPRAWTRARRTILSADTVQIIGAIVLYFLAIGVVKGFAFTLGLSTLVDIAVVFLFTHPLVSWLSRFRLLNNESLSGLHTKRRNSPDAPAGAVTLSKES